MTSTDRISLVRTALAGAVALSLSGAQLAAPCAAESQPAGTVARIGCLAGSVASGSRVMEAFRQGLRDLGYVEGRNLVIEYRDAEGEPERLPALAAQLVARTIPIVFLSSPMFIGERRRLADLATRHRLPAMISFREYVEAGGLMSYRRDLAELFRRSATYVDKRLKGARPGDLPVEQPTRFELVINLKTARTLGLTIPPPLLPRADHVIDR